MTAKPAGRAPWYRFIPFAVLAFFLGAAFYYQAGLEARAAVGERAPDFTLSALDASTVTLSDFEGRTVVLNFWTTWCPECEGEVAALEAIHQAYGDRVAVIGVNMREPPAVVLPFVSDHAMTYPILLDRSESVAKRYRVTGVPETWIIAPDGTAVLHRLGPMTFEQLEYEIDRLVGAPGRTS